MCGEGRIWLLHKQTFNSYFWPLTTAESFCVPSLSQSWVSQVFPWGDLTHLLVVIPLQVTDHHLLCHDKSLTSSLSVGLKFLLLSAIWWMRTSGLCKLPDGRDWLWGKLGLALVGRAMLSESLIYLSADGWSCAPSLLVIWRGNQVLRTIIPQSPEWKPQAQKVN